MSAAALTPRIRVLAVCDEAVFSEIEANVLTLEGVRHGFAAESFPCVRALSIYLLLSSARGGSFVGEVKLAPVGEEMAIRMSKFDADFEDSRVIALGIELGDCVFQQPGTYS